MQIKGVLPARLVAALSVIEHYLCNVKFKTMLCKHVTSLGRDDDHELYGYAYMQQSLSVISGYGRFHRWISLFTYGYNKHNSNIHVQYEIDFDICVRSWFESQSRMTKVKTDSVSTNVKRSATTRLEWHGSFRWDHKDRSPVSSLLNDRQSSAYLYSPSTVL